MKFIALLSLSLSFFTFQLNAQKIDSLNSIKELPVKLIIQEDSESIYWTLPKEVNSSFFIIERAEDGKSFEAIATIKAKGHSVMPTEYTYEWYTDKSPNKVSYRIILVGMDGLKTLVGTDTGENPLTNNLAAKEQK